MKGVSGVKGEDLTAAFAPSIGEFDKGGCQIPTMFP